MPFKQTPRSFALTAFVLIVMLYVTRLFHKHTLVTLPPLRNIIARRIERGKSEEISKIERGESEESFKIVVKEELEEVVEPVKGTGQEVAMNDGEKLLSSSSRETPETLDSDSFMGTVDQRSTTSINDTKPIDEYVLQSFVDASLEGIKGDLVELLMGEYYQIFGGVESDFVRTCTGSSSPPRPSFRAPVTKSASSSSSSSRNIKRGRLNQDDPDDWEKDGGRKPTRKKPKDTSQPFASHASQRRYACPYNKHNPGKFRHGCDGKFSACDGPGFDNIAHTK